MMQENETYENFSSRIFKFYGSSLARGRNNGLESFKHLITTRDYTSFVERIDIINADAVAKGLSPRI
jgi:hypothetical protein